MYATASASEARHAAFSALPLPRWSSRMNPTSSRPSERRLPISGVESVEPLSAMTTRQPMWDMSRVKNARRVVTLSSRRAPRSGQV